MCIQNKVSTSKNSVFIILSFASYRLITDWHISANVENYYVTQSCLTSFAYHVTMHTHSVGKPWSDKRIRLNSFHPCLNSAIITWLPLLDQCQSTTIDVFKTNHFLQRKHWHARVIACKERWCSRNKVALYQTCCYWNNNINNNQDSWKHRSFSHWIYL